MKKIVIITIGVVIMASLVARLLFSGNEDTWICEGGEWVKHGNPAGNPPQEECKPELIGGQKDEHGCLTPAGYRWCESRQKCLRTWEEYCAEYPEQFTQEKLQVQKYIEDNITKLSPVEPVLGGSWNKPDVLFTDESVVEVTYEDGHIQERFRAKYQIEKNTVTISNIIRTTE